MKEGGERGKVHDRLALGGGIQLAVGVDNEFWIVGKRCRSYGRAMKDK